MPSLILLRILYYIGGWKFQSNLNYIYSNNNFWLSLNPAQIPNSTDQLSVYSLLVFYSPIYTIYICHEKRSSLILSSCLNTSICIFRGQEYFIEYTKHPDMLPTQDNRSKTSKTPLRHCSKSSNFILTCFKE